MEVIIAKNYESLSELAAEKVAKVIKTKKYPKIGLPTGSTPMGMYKRLIDMNKRGEISFKDVVTFNLDEYEGLDKKNPSSYYRFMMENFFGHIDIDLKNAHIPDGTSNDIYKECTHYEEKIKLFGGIDLTVLGIGNNGHIGFNEPNTYFSKTTHRVKLHDDTIKVNSRFFSHIKDVPHYAITMGIKSIMSSNSIMLLANGMKKAEAIKNTVEGPITPAAPASILQLHDDVTVIVDEEAAAFLTDY